MKVSIALSSNVFEPLTYQIEPGARAVKVGARVLVPLGKRIASGWITRLDSPYPGKLKNVIGIIDDPFCPDEPFLEFARRSAVAYFTSAGVVLDHALPASKKNLKKLFFEQDGQTAKFTDVTAAQLEKMAARRPLRFFFKDRGARAVETGKPVAADPALQSRLLLAPDREQDYRELAAAVVASGRSVLLVVPDNASARYWQSVWPELDVYNSETRTALKEDIWALYLGGKSGVVCGGLSAVLLPFCNLGLLIIDRAASPLYQRSFRNPFHTAHLARIRAEAGNIPVVQGASSHSCATYRSHGQPLVSDRRQDRGGSSRIHALKSNERGIPDAIIQLIQQNFLQQRKTLVLLNRVQPARHLFCPRCGKIAACPNCGSILQVDEPQKAACRRCSFQQANLTACPRCQNDLTLLHDLSLDSLARAVERRLGEQAVLPLRAADLKDMERILAAVQGSAVVIATPAVLNPFFKKMFSSVIYVKPESFFGMDEFNSAEMIYTTAAEILDTLVDGGELHVFSVFHFHYALQFLMNEEQFFERELKYRQWFLLPPFSNVYQLEIRNGSLRSLAAAMRDLFRKHKDELQIRKIYLLSRQPLRGLYRGVVELHAPAEKIIASGLQQMKKSSLSLLAG